MYNLAAKFLQKAISIKGTKLKIINGFQNRTATPKALYIKLHIIDDNQMSTPETRYTDK